MGFRRIIIPAISFLLLFFISGEGADLHPPELLPATAAGGYDPAISPNGRYLAFTSKADGNEDIWVLDLNKSEKWKLTRNTSADYSPCFLGNDELLFVSTRGSSGGEIYRSDIKGKKIKKIIGGYGYFDSPSVSSDRRIIAYVHSESRDKVRIQFLDTKTDQTTEGPPGLEPAFSSLDKRIVFLHKGDETDNPVLAIFDLKDGSLVEIETGETVISNPSFIDDGRAVVCAVHENDTDGDGIVTRNDFSRLIIYGPDDPGKSRWLYPGYRFGEPAVSVDGTIYAASEDVEIYSLSESGAVAMLESARSQALLCDSLLSHPGDRDDSLFTAAVCLSSFYHYPDSCGKFLLTAADYYSSLGIADLAQSTLSGLQGEVGPDLTALAELKRSKIAFDAARKETVLKAWREAYDIARRIASDPSQPPEVTKQAYIHGIEVSYAAGRLDEGTELIVEGLLRFTGDEEMTALLEIWRLRYKARSYAGDPLDLVPLYVEYLTRFWGQQVMADTVIRDLVRLTGSMDPELAVNALDNIQRRYPDQKKLAVGCLYEQGRRLERSGQPEIARWKYEEIIDNFKDYPGYRFLAFSNLGDLRLGASEPDEAEAYFDSARAYLNHAGSASARAEFLQGYSRLKAFQGYVSLSRDPQEAYNYFQQSYETDPDNIDAVWGLVRSLSLIGDEKRWKETDSIFESDHERIYFHALREIALYDESGNVSTLKIARELLLKATDQDRRFFPADLALGYIDCMLETLSSKSPGLYEEAVEMSLAGLSLAKGESSLEAAFHLNLAEAYYGLGQYKSAFENYTAAMRSLPETTSIVRTDAVLLKLADSALQIDSLQRAEEVYKDLYSRSSKSANAELQALTASRLGLIYQSQGMYVEALEYYEPALPFYSSQGDIQQSADILKCQAICYKALGEQEKAFGAAQKARALFEKAGGRRIYDNRMKLTVWPFGLTVPLITMEGMNYGGSVYPLGLTESANRALLTRIEREDENVTESIETRRELIDILMEGKEKYSTVDIRNSLGRLYFETGYLDSAAAAFRSAYTIARDRDDYAGAYVQLSDWAVCLLSRSDTRLSDSEKNEIEDIRSECERLVSMIPAAYGAPRASLKNFAGAAEFLLIVSDLDTPQDVENADLAAWIADLRGDAVGIMSRLEDVRRLFGEGLSEVALGDEPALVASLSLNEALVAWMLGDEDGYNTSMGRAVTQARLSGSEREYAEIIGIKGLLSDRDTAERKTMLTESIEVYENFKPGPLVQRDAGLINEIYRQAIEGSLVGGDSLTALGLLERRKGLELAGIMAENPDKYPTAPLLKANISQMEDHRRELSRLRGVKRRLIALGKSGLVDLKKTEESILETRSRFLETKEDIKSMAPSLAAALFPDVDPPEAICRNIPAGEICLVPFVSEHGDMIWACDSQGIEALEFSSDNDTISTRLRELAAKNDIITIVPGDLSGMKLIQYLKDVFPGKEVKSAYSLNEAHGAEGAFVGKLDGVGLLSFDGGVIDSETVRQIGAVAINDDSIRAGAGIGEYGWLLIDGEFHEDKQNPLLSYWELAGQDEDLEPSRIYLFEVAGKLGGSYGVIVMNFPEIDSWPGEWAMFKVFFGSGARTVITVPKGFGAEISSEVIEEFFGNLGSMSPLESFTIAAGQAGMVPAAQTPTMSYYGGSGWNPDQRKNKAKEWYQESVYAGYSAMADGNWRRATAYFERAERQAELADMADVIGKDVARKLVYCYIRLGNSEKALAAQLRLVALCASDTSCLKEEWRKYIEIASGAKMADEEISAWHTLHDLALRTDDSRVAYECDVEMAEYFLGRDNLPEAERLLRATAGESAGVTDLSILARRALVYGRMNLLSGRYPEAESSFSAAEILYEKSGDMRGEYSAVLSLAEMYREIGALMSERSSLTAALSYFRDSGDSLSMIECLLKLAANYRDCGRPADSRKFVDEILRYEPDDPDGLSLLSDLLRKRGDLDSAFDVTVRAKDISEQKRSTQRKAEAHYNMAQIRESLGDTGSASDEYRLAMEYARSSSGGSILDWSRYKYGMLHTENGDSVLADVENKTKRPFVRDLCRYQMALGSIRDDNRDKATTVLREILDSDDRQTGRYLKWRCLYHLGEMSGKAEKEAYFSQADSVYRQYLPEPKYMVDDYELDIRPRDLYYAMANAMIRSGDIDEAVILYERAALSGISADYLSRGTFDKIENDLIDSCSIASESGIAGSIEGLKGDFFRNHPLYAPLWGEPDMTDLEFRGDLGPSEAIIRFYVQPDSAAVFYIDADTVAYNIIKTNTVELQEDAAGLQETMRNQRRADSLLERWYTMLISDFEDLMQNREKIMLIPDGPLVRFPLEALKMPGGDYLGEIFSTIRGTHLETGLPKTATGRYLPCVDNTDIANGGHMMKIVESICEALGDCHGREAGRVRFAVNAESSDRKLPDGEIMCFLDMSDYNDATEFLVDLLKMRKGGYEQSIQTLWPTTDQAAAYYYWTLLDKLRQGKGITESQRAAKSFLYGRYRGSAYYWPGHALYSLN